MPHAPCAAPAALTYRHADASHAAHFVHSQAAPIYSPYLSHVLKRPVRHAPVVAETADYSPVGVW